MSKRSGLGVLTDEDRDKPLKLSKPSLDSDEEDYDESSVFRLLEADIDGQEAATVEYDDTVKITPFNMKEELEEDGYFDAAGMFIFKKTTDVRDNWLEDIDWVEVKKREETVPLTDTAISDEPPEVEVSKSRKIDLYRQLLQYVKPSETILRAIKRMGGSGVGKASASERWLKKKKTQQELVKGDPEGLIKTTELADQLLQAGDFDIYQKTYADLDQILHESEQSAQDDELDALGKALDGQDGNDQSESQPPEDNYSTTVMWHLKRSANSEMVVEGPYTTAQLKQWVDEDKFKDCPVVLVRETTKPNGQFYSINRIDFDLYD